jgi:predicted DNA-binding antitoxin AbrB/MazE fold protein
MSKTIEAVYENGVFKPVKKIKLPEHKKLTIIIESTGKRKPRSTRTLRSIFDIAKDCSDTSLSTHHDNFLYGGDEH